MPLFAITAVDTADGLRLRGETRAAHSAYVQAHRVKVVCVGPLHDADGRMTGSLAIVSAADFADVEDFVGGDPYKAAGIYAEVQIRRWTEVMGRLTAD
jgi:uncharacterized protein